MKIRQLLPLLLQKYNNQGNIRLYKRLNIVTCRYKYIRNILTEYKSQKILETGEIK